jgi:hypothetical protein
LLKRTNYVLIKILHPLIQLYLHFQALLFGNAIGLHHCSPESIKQVFTL